MAPEKRQRTREALDRYYTPAWVTRALMEHLIDPWPDLGVAVLDPCAGLGGVADVVEMELTGGVGRELWQAIGEAGPPAHRRRVVHRQDIDAGADGRNRISDFLATDRTHELDSKLMHPKLSELPYWARTVVRRRRFARALPGAGLDGKWHEYEPGWYDWVITNPPYALSTGAKASDFVRQAFAFAPCVAMLLRLSWLEPCPDRADILQRRPPQQIIILPRISFTGPHGRRGTDSVTSAWFVWDPFAAHSDTRLGVVSKSDVARLNGQQNLFGDSQ
jgi:hypothetical protein